MKVLYTQGNYRITEAKEEHYDMENLKGDCYNPEVNTDISPEQLRTEELPFERLVFDYGVYGYTLEVWNPEIDCGWKHVDSCGGFVGNYNLDKHYIVDELKEQIKG